jgi:hypothetical protein
MIVSFRVNIIWSKLLTIGEAAIEISFCLSLLGIYPAVYGLKKSDSGIRFRAYGLFLPLRIGWVSRIVSGSMIKYGVFIAAASLCGRYRESQS